MLTHSKFCDFLANDVAKFFTLFSKFPWLISKRASEISVAYILLDHPLSDNGCEVKFVTQDFKTERLAI